MYARLTINLAVGIRGTFNKHRQTKTPIAAPCAPCLLPFSMGPTASGKTAAAMALYDALPVELISVDSAQVFIDMNIGTAKPGMSGY